MTVASALTLWLVAQDDSIAQSIEKLRHREIHVREEAEDALVALGESAVPRLQKLSAVETDPEVRSRLARAVQRITSLDWFVDLDPAMKQAEREGKRVFVLSSPGPLQGPT